MKLNKVVVAGALPLAAAVALAAGALQADAAQAGTHKGLTGNTVEHVGAGSSTYVPNVTGASPESRKLAQNLLDGVNQFCRTHTAAGIRATWEPGKSGPVKSTHWHNPGRQPLLDPSKPQMALIHNNTLVGVVFNAYKALPYLGSIPRPHGAPPGGHAGHGDVAHGGEMLHVYCVLDLKTAFTPRMSSDIKQGKGVVGPNTPKPPTTTTTKPGSGNRAETRQHIIEHLKKLDAQQLKKTNDFLHELTGANTTTTVKNTSTTWKKNTTTTAHSGGGHDGHEGH